MAEKTPKVKAKKTLQKEEGEAEEGEPAKKTPEQTANNPTKRKQKLRWRATAETVTCHNKERVSRLLKTFSHAAGYAQPRRWKCREVCATTSGPHAMSSAAPLSSGFGSAGHLLCK